MRRQHGKTIIITYDKITRMHDLRGGSGNLDSGDKWKFCLRSA